MSMTKEEQAEHLKKCRELSAAKRKEAEAKADVATMLSSKLDKLIDVMTEIRDKLPNKMKTDFLK